MIRSICSAFVNAPLFRKRSADAKLLWFALYLHQAQHMCGLMRLDLEHMALDACMPLERTRAALVELIQHKLCQVDTQQELVCVVEMTAQAAKIIRPNWTGYKAVDKYLASLGASPLCKTVCDILSIPYRYPIDTLPDTVSDTVSDTLLLGSDTGSESDPDTGTGSFAVGHAPPPPSGTQGALIPDVLPSPKPAPERNRKPRKARAAKDSPETTARTNPVWEAYSAAYLQEHGALPTRNGMINGQLADFLGRVPVEEAPAIAAFYARHPDAWLRKNFHPIGALLKNAEGFRTEWQRGQQVTMTQARRNEQTAANPWVRRLAEMDREKPPESVECRVDDDDDKGEE